MILVRTKLGSSGVEGIGLFADQFIPEGTRTWEYHPRFDASFDEEDMNEMPEPVKEQFLKYAFFDPQTGKYILCFDDQRFINHSTVFPNILSTPYYDTAARDIFPGEELLCNYADYEDTYFERRGIDVNTWL